MENTNTLYTGFSKVDYTPDFPVGLAGYGNVFARRNTEIAAHVFVTCVAFRSGEDTALLYTIDTCGLRIYHIRRFREAVQAATGVPETNIFFGATHSHNCPTMTPGGEPSVDKTLELMENAIVESAKNAIADLSETQMLAAKPLIPGMNFTRHYRTDDGRRLSANAGMVRKTDVLAGHLGPNDPYMVLVKLVREGKKDIVLMNWQAHPDDAQEVGFCSIGSGFVGPTRDELEALSGCNVAYFNGASGNQVRKSRIPALNPDLPYVDYGKKLAQMAYAAFDQLQPISGTDIKVTRAMLPVVFNHTEDHKLEQAKEVVENIGKLEKEEFRALYKGYGFSTSAHARGVIHRADCGETDELELNAFRVGPLAFVTNTCETFSNQGLHAKEHSPFEYTMVITGNRSYLGAWHSYEYGAYEAVGGSSNYVQGTAEAMGEKWVELLTELV